MIDQEPIAGFARLYTECVKHTSFNNVDLFSYSHAARGKNHSVTSGGGRHRRALCQILSKLDHWWKRVNRVPFSFKADFYRKWSTFSFVNQVNTFRIPLNWAEWTVEARGWERTTIACILSALGHCPRFVKWYISHTI